MNISTPALAATLSPPLPTLFDRRHAPLSVGVLALVSLLAYEALAVNTAMPVIAAALQATAWYPLAFGAAMAGALVGMVIGGKQSDRDGPARPLLQGLAWFIAGLLLAGLAPGIGTLVLGRLLQGLGSGLQAVALYAFVGRVFPSALHPRIFGLFAAAWVLPALIGPLLTGLIVTHLGWRWVFLAVPLLALPCLWLLWPALREQAPPAAAATTPGSTHRTLPWAVVAAVAALLLPLAGAAWAWSSLPLVVVMLCCARALLPAGSLRLRPGLPAVIALRGLIAAAFASIEIYLPLLLQSGRGWSPTEAGAALTVGALSWAAGSQAQASWPRHWGERWLLFGGTALLGLGLLPLLALASGAPAWWALPAMLVSGVGIGVVFPRLSVLTLALATPSAQGRAASALQLSDALVTAVVTALAGLLFSHWIASDPTLAFVAVFGVALGLTLVGLCAGWRGGQPLV